jgi:hypothetical protein
MRFFSERSECDAPAAKRLKELGVIEGHLASPFDHQA